MCAFRSDHRRRLLSAIAVPIAPGKGDEILVAHGVENSTRGGRIGTYKPAAASARYRESGAISSTELGQPQTPPWLEQQPCLFEQLKQVGDRVPSQHWRPPPLGSVTSIVIVRITEPQPPDVRSVTTSVPLLVASYLADPAWVPDDGTIALPREEVSVQELIPLTEIPSVALRPVCMEPGPESDAVAAEFSITTATASLPEPQALLALPEKAVLVPTDAVWLPDAGRKAPMPSMETLAV